MGRIERMEQRLRLVKPPPLIVVDAPELTPDDVLVVCAGFEERALGTLRLAARIGASGFKVVGVHYKPAVSENRESEMAALCTKCSAELHIVTYDRENPEGAGLRVMAAAATAHGSIVIDISGMSRLLIVQILHELSLHRGFEHVKVIYCEPDSYSPSSEQVNESLATADFETLMFISAGVFGVTVVPELSTVSMLGQPIHVVAFPSFNPRQLFAIHADMQGADYTLIHGSSPRQEHEWRTDAIKQLNTVPLPSVEDVVTSTLDYRETLEYLVKVYEDRSTTRRLVIAPTGSKMQAVAVGLFRAFMHDVQIVYPTPRTFTEPESYSQGCRTLYAVGLDAYADLQRTLHAANGSA